MNKKKIYLYLQTGGWLLYVLMAGLLNVLRGNALDLSVIGQLAAAFIIGWGTSHLYRHLIIKFKWTELKITPLIPRVLIASILFAVLFQALYIGVTLPVIGYRETDVIDSISRTLNWGVLFILWSMIYFTFHFFERYRNEEIKNLQWQASKNEIELNKLKSQLNPHFIFNAMNTIKALIDENPKKAKRSVTGLSNILRKTLMMGRQKTVSFEEELQLVKHYLDLEKARFEERLEFDFDIDERSDDYQVPGLMLQTLVENGIKHGISKFTEGGKIELSTRVIDGALHIKIRNPGVLPGSDRKNGKGFGLVNSRERLRLLYGRDDLLTLENAPGNTVITHIEIPSKQHEL